MLALVAAHLLVALVLPFVAARSTRATCTVAALPPAAALAWVLTRAGDVLGGQEIVETLAWAPHLGLEITFRLDPLALLMTLLVSGMGVLVLLYSVGYFGSSADGKRSAPLLLAFAGVMLGLVLADDLLVVYIFWELTTICSFLLVGQAGISRESRRSAMQALLVTIFGGLAMLLGFIVLGEAAETYLISELVANPPGGDAIGVAAVLILIGAFTKSAQLPFHNWLPAAMVAPTPISAYLHAASMVKAGVFLVAALTPVFLGVAHWSVLTAVFGTVTMIVAGWRALHEYDLKKLLAYGTVSQLGFLMVLAGAGTRIAAMAAVAMLLAHGLFKAALFLIVGIIDHQAGTRDLRELSGLGKRMPWLAVIATLAAASMAGLPPALGFLGKEAAFEGFLHGGSGDLVIVAGLVLGSVFTVGYTARLLWGAFAGKRGVAATEARSSGAVLFLPAALPAIAGVVLGAAYPLVDVLSAGYADVFDAGADPYHLALWHGPSLPLLCSLLALAGGLTVHAARGRITSLRERLPNPLNAQRGYERIMALLERIAVGVTGRLQAGSLPTYLGVILLTVLTVSGSALLTRHTPIEDLRAWDRILQVPLAVVILIAVVGVVRARRRLTAVLLVGVIGYGIGGMFIVDGAPDLALTQFLVETLTLVAFVFVLRRLPPRFIQSEPAPGLRIPKMLIAIAGGVFMAFASMIFSSARQTRSGVSEQYIARAEEGAGATNVVNAIIVDFRAFDTIGEISVLAVTATGVASLVLTSRYQRRRRRGSLPMTEQPASDEAEPPRAGHGRGPPRGGPGAGPRRGGSRGSGAQGSGSQQEEVRE
ncbi:hydrogen gas-evolving membrane-bound hydrogenase subunit E [Haloactinomyces albus]|uniref:Multicomponent Na+:H+ antiporter subunit A n=1 Tax=Haloactinomyces albus TaxID=1352928 RepID=A0AAE3ZCX8_9ACTN|nr:hydrogen gas-evolving membrane-bound hydrogenase subunit E [Haloactinomyces albus]MDR7301358.1 multicomponent Na+:H+ antiporter subunit A [Haloactinomyces albus]